MGLGYLELQKAMVILAGSEGFFLDIHGHSTEVLDFFLWHLNSKSCWEFGNVANVGDFSEGRVFISTEEGVFE